MTAVKSWRNSNEEDHRPRRNRRWYLRCRYPQDRSESEHQPGSRLLHLELLILNSRLSDEGAALLGGLLSFTHINEMMDETMLISNGHWYTSIY